MHAIRSQVVRGFPKISLFILSAVVVPVCVRRLLFPRGTLPSHD